MKRFTPQQRQQWVQQWKQSRCTLAQFAQQHGIGKSTLTRWAHQLKQQHPTTSAFVQLIKQPTTHPHVKTLPIADTVNKPHEPPIISIEFRGTIVRVPQSIDPSWLDQVVQSLVRRLPA